VFVAKNYLIILSSIPMITINDILAARTRIADAVEATPCDPSAALSDLVGCEIFCKLESLHATGSFKERGARNALLLLNETQRQRGVIAASAGNHALALAYHGAKLRIPVTVVMPKFAPLVKQANCRKRGATVVLHGDTFAEARSRAQTLCEEQGLTYINGFNDPAIIAGQGTMGLEIFEQVPHCDAVIIPIGGAGMMAGTALALKHFSPQTEIIGVEPAVSPSFTLSLQANTPTAVPLHPTLADGLAVACVGNNAFEIARGLVDRVVTVTEQQIALAVVRLMELEKCVVEGAGAASLAALLTGKLPHLQGKRVVLILSGGNIDLTILERLIETTLVADGRLVRFTATISDRPGGLAVFASLLAECGVSVKDVFHDRAFSGPNVARVNVVCTVETRDYEHQAELFSRLQAAHIPVVAIKPTEESSELA
jgi:threonine dehydratase